MTFACGPASSNGRRSTSLFRARGPAVAAGESCVSITPQARAAKNTIRMKNAKTYVGIAILFVIALTLGYFSYNSPLTTLDNIRKAAKQNDKDRLRDLIDFDLVKAGLKEDLKAQLMRDSVGRSEQPFRKFGIAVATMMVDPLVDTIVCPGGLTLIGNGLIDRVISPEKKLVNDVPPREISIEESSTHDGLHIERGYDEFSRYRIRIRRSETNPADAWVLTLTREGLFSWKLTRISIPTNLLTDTGNRSDASPQEQADAPAIESSDLQADPTHHGLLLLTTTLLNRGRYRPELPVSRDHTP